MTEEARNPRKVRRISRACDYCHHRSIRCKPSGKDGESRCQNCVDFEQPCTFDRPVKRRGKGRSAASEATGHTARSASKSQADDDDSRIEPRSSAVAPSPASNGTRSSLLPSTLGAEVNWRAPPVASQAVIMDLVEIYFEVVYPM